MKVLGFITTQLLILLLLLGVNGDSAYSQSREPTADDITVYAGAVTYPDPGFDSLVLVEFPFSLNRNDFEFFRPDNEDSSLYARIFAQVDLLDSYGMPIDSASTYFSARVATRTDAFQAGYRLFNKLILFTKPGVYSARVTVIDAVSKSSGSGFIDRIVVAPPTSGSLTIGGPAPAYHIEASTDTLGVSGRLTRNGFKVIPNPIAVFGETDTSLYIYAELYNLGDEQGDASPVTVSFDVLQDGELVRPLGVRRFTKPVSGNSVAFVESFDIKRWPSGLYRLRLAAKDAATGEADTSRTDFRIITRQEILTAVRESRRPNDPYNELTAEQKIQLVEYALTPPEKETLSRLTESGKLNFLEQYWKEHGYVAPAGDNPTRTELIKRFTYANRHFSTDEAKGNGWLTDRGRIYMTYGPWERIVDRDVPQKNSGYQIWYYDSMKEGKLFVFVEDWRRGYVYTLVHSTVYSEVFDKEWERILREGTADINPDVLYDDIQQ